MLRADLVGHRADDVGELLLDPGVDGLAHPRRQVAPQLRVLALAWIRSTSSRMSPREVARMCSAILSGSSCW